MADICHNWLGECKRRQDPEVSKAEYITHLLSTGCKSQPKILFVNTDPTNQVSAIIYKYIS